MSVHSHSKLNEFFGIVFLASSCLLLLSLISYDSMDPGLHVAAPHRQYANYAGKIGAMIADYLFELFGLAAFLLPVPFIFAGYRKVRGRPIDSPFLKLFGFTAITFSVCAGFSLLSPALPDSVSFTPGGIIGILSSRLLLFYLNRPGSLIVITAALVGALVLTTRFSLVGAGDWMGRKDWKIASRIAGWFKQWKANRARKQELSRIRKDHEAIVTRSVPRRVTMGENTAPAETEPLPDPLPEHPVQENPPVLTTPKRSESSLPQEWNPKRAVRPAGEHQLLELPSLDFLQLPLEETSIDEAELIERARKLAAKCAEFEVHGKVLQIHPGPVVTTFEFKPDPGVKYSKITNLSDDLCLAMKAESVRIDRIPGKNTVGIEVPNRDRRIIYLREILASAAFQQSSSRLTLALGQLINGNTYVTDLARMPHLLIAGSTGSGKSVGLNCMVCSILYKASPAEVRFIMVDPKRLELGVYEGIPHLLTPIVTDPRKAANALNWAVREMEERYKLLAEQGVRNIDQYNRLAEQSDFQGDELERLPYIVVIVDELADLMMTAGKDVEAALTRLAQMARAVGIHLILATQRPSVDVLTGLIKANFPSRISFRVSSKIDSRTILDSSGGEQLLGMGDSLFLAPGTSRLIRVHGAFISEKEIANITRFLKKQADPEYREEILEGGDEEEEGALVNVGDMEDELYDEAARFVVDTGRASTSLLQRRFRIGYGRAARLLDMMEHEGVVGPSEGTRPREVLVSSGYFEEIDSRDE